MLRRFTVRLLSQSRRRAYSTSDVPAEGDPFTAAWRQIVPNVDPPKTPLAFVQPRPSAAASESIPSKLTINMVSRYSSQISNKQVLYSLYLPISVNAM